MKYGILVLVVWSVFCITMAQPAKKKIVNFGFLAGVNAPFVDMHSYSVNGVRLEKPAVSSKVGYMVATFARVNIRKHFIQVEASTHYSRSDIHLDMADLIPASDHPPVWNDMPAVYHERLRSLEMPLLYGYNFIKDGPYELSFLIGPKLKYIFSRKGNVEEEPGKQLAFNEELNRLTYNVVLGLSTTISNLLLNVRYEFGLQNISKSLNYGVSTSDGYSVGNIGLRRAINLISVSVGVIF